jgi:hypothetical protein
MDARKKMLSKKIYHKIVPAAIRKKVFPYVHAYIRHEVQRKTNGQVLYGPFKGMRIDLKGAPLCTFLGTIEKEIHPVFAKLSVFRFKQIINIGATEGYYAVGMALKYPDATVYAFEMQEVPYRAKIAKLASINLVSDRVNIRGYCSATDLVNLLTPYKSTLLMLDVEGDEINLLDPLAIDGLRRTTILVELHDMLVPGCSRIIEERFQNTHAITKYTTRPRTLKDFPLRAWNITNPIIGPFAVEAITERLTTQGYFLMIPKNCRAI